MTDAQAPVPVLMAEAASDRAFAASVAILLAHEGGFQKAPDDPGNWTGGRIGAGALKGTKYGISAAQYPALDIEGLSAGDAAAIYRRDWWDRFGLDRLPAMLAAKLLDAGVNIGMENALRALQRGLRACGKPVAEDGILGAATLAAIAAAAPETLLAALREALAGHYRLIAARSKSQQRFLAGWLARAYS
ncbi:MAG TPA: glycosyl hydrolase 108 family protein [Stellaceae bacterium]|jgi:lysozyme family protein|nr:glycosyl hydrolase 108 family protein [Stellaceae bacterium]